ncbi:Ff.00g131410.m01.CDS01 [Fusarium sp. VM40]|nr:Ff.00g131410.m01.CDS01 [Fusarium sp. VM40]
MDKKRCQEPLEPSNINWMKDQIHRCEEQCDHTAYDPKFLPTRLIDVGTQHGDDARLVITADLPKSQDDGVSHSVKYATLSYCWGPKEDAKQQVKTTRDNLSLHLNRMPLSEMSPVVEDTILVCRALNIRYVWVDALCILQGDARDWDKESEMMGKVYYCSYLTICPLVSTSCMQGYLTPRASGIEIEFQSSLRPGVRGTYSIFECQEIVVPDRPPSLLSRHLDKNQSSWPTRGWTFQEGILSLRILFFGESMSHFSCENKDSSENGYLVDNSSGHCQGRRLIESESLSLDSVRKRIEIYDLWDFIKMIQGRKWTYKEDFLPGLSGIAKQYANMVNDVYLAGHWKDNLLYDLTWEVCWPEPGDLDKRLNLLRNPSPYVAPSWSWASQESKVDRAIDTQYILEEQEEDIDETDENRFKLWSYTTTQMCHTRSEFKLEEFKMDLWGVSPFGRLKGGFIRVSGKVVPFPSKVLIRKREDSGRHDFGYFTDGLGTCQFDWTSQLDTVQEPGRMRLLPITSCCSSTSNWRRIMWYANPEDNPEELRRNLIEGDQLCRALGKDWVERQDCKCCKDEGLARNTWGLIIHPAEEPGSFCRIGVFLLPAYSGGSNLFKDIESQTIMLI